MNVHILAYVDIREFCTRENRRTQRHSTIIIIIIVSALFNYLYIPIFVLMLLLTAVATDSIVFVGVFCDNS